MSPVQADILFELAAINCMASVISLGVALACLALLLGGRR